MSNLQAHALRMLRFSVKERLSSALMWVFCSRVCLEQRLAFGKRCSAFGVWFGCLNVFGAERCSFLNVFGNVFVFVHVCARVRARSLMFVFAFVFGGSRRPCLCSCSD